ncbi:MAG: helix-turn-helix domain-containing protein [Candidatus Obscuribacterales bacterium]
MAIAMAQQYETGESSPPVSSMSGYYTMVPNAFFDALLPQLAPEQVVIACWILRHTTGWDREWSPAIGYRRLGEEASLDKMTVMRHVQAGLKAGWLARQGSGTSFEYRISGWLDGSFAKQQPLNGNFTKVPHAFFESLVPTLDPIALKVCCWIIRQTIGWNREWTNSVSYDRLARLTGLSRSAVIRHLQSLQGNGLVGKETVKGTGRYRLSHPTTWADQFKRGCSALSNMRPNPCRHSCASQVYAERDSDSVCTQTLKVYAERDDERMRRDTDSPRAKERKERYKRTTTRNGSSSLPSYGIKENTKRICDQAVIVSLDRVRQNVSTAAYEPKQTSRKQPPTSVQDRAERLAEIADLDLDPGAKATLVSHFPVKVLRQGMAWLATADSLTDLGRAFYAACRDGYEPKSSTKMKLQENRAWALEKFGHLEGKQLYGHQLEIRSSEVHLVGGGPEGTEVIGLSAADFQPRLQEAMERLTRAQSDRDWASAIVEKHAVASKDGRRVQLNDRVAWFCVGGGVMPMQYGQPGFREALSKVLDVPAS